MSEFKYLEVEVTRTEGTTVFLKVPKDFNFKACANFTDILAAACDETVSASEWGDAGWRDTVEWQAIKEVPKEEAEQYVLYEMNPPDAGSEASNAVDQTPPTKDHE